MFICNSAVYKSNVAVYSFRFTSVNNVSCKGASDQISVAQRNDLIQYYMANKCANTAKNCWKDLG